MDIMRNNAAVLSLALLAGVSNLNHAANASPYSAINAAAAADPITVNKLRGGISMLSGSGGNISVLADARGLFMVDAGIAVSKLRIEAALRSIAKVPVRYVVNTHWHWDHTDGNAWLRQAGATIIADRSTRLHLMQTIRVVEWEHTFTPIARQSLPNDVISRNRLIRFGGERIAIRRYRPSHTDGDLSVYFERADVLATGDTFWNGLYPFIDYVAGGSIKGAIGAANANLLAAGPHTQIIPGHGPVGTKAQLVAFRDMLVSVRDKVAALKARGQSENEVVALHPTAALDGKWAGGVINGALFTRLVYRGV